MTKVLHGVPAAGGRSAGRVYPFVRRTIAQASPFSDEPQSEWQRFAAAQQTVIAELRSGQSSGQIGGQIGALDAAGELRAAHLLILEDPALLDAVHDAIETRGLAAVAAVQEATASLSATIAALDDPYFAARAADVRDAGGRLLAALSGDNPDAELDALPTDTILVADDLTPSQVARLDPARVRGIVLRRGSALAHAAILAGSLGIAMVCNVRDIAVAAGDLCAVDGDAGVVTLFDADETPTEIPANQIPSTTLPSTTTLFSAPRSTDMSTLLLGNANTLADLEQIRRTGLHGVGLLRTEFLFPRHTVPPTLDEQTALFSSLLAAAPDGIFTVRALDAGGDKEIPWLSPARFPGIVGRRGVRLLLAEPDLLRTQYRALLRALVAANRPKIAARFLLPMVTDAEEVARVLSLLDEVTDEEEELMDDFAPDVAIGVMIEAPAAVLTSPDIAPQCAFLSIGTNDLAHFLFATERASADPDALADPLHPAALRAIAMTCESAQAYGIPVAVCGEVASNPLAAPLLVGLGVSELSLRASSAPLVHAALGRYTQEQCQRVAYKAFHALGAPSVHQLLATFSEQKPRSKQKK